MSLYAASLSFMLLLSSSWCIQVLVNSTSLCTVKHEGSADRDVMVHSSAPHKEQTDLTYMNGMAHFRTNILIIECK